MAATASTRMRISGRRKYSGRQTNAVQVQFGSLSHDHPDALDAGTFFRVPAKFEDSAGSGCPLVAPGMRLSNTFRAFPNWLESESALESFYWVDFSCGNRYPLFRKMLQPHYDPQQRSATTAYR